MLPEQRLDADGPRVWIVGRSALGRSGLRALLQERDVRVVGTSSELAADTPNVQVLLLLDGNLSTLPPHSAVLLIGDQWQQFPDDERAWGLLPSDASPAEVWAAVVALSAGLCVLPPTMLAQTMRVTNLASSVQDIEPLTAREEEVLQLLAEGLTNRQIASRLTISEHTVKFHLSSIFGKLGVMSRTEAIRVGAQQGLIVW